MGVFYYIHSVALIEDLPIEEHYKTPTEFYAAADRAYSQVSHLLFIYELHFSNTISVFRMP